MKYKALMLDVDGTLIPYDYDALPSEKVCKSIRDIEGLVSVNLVTGRSIKSVSRVLERLGISKGFAAVDNGSRVLSIETNELIYDQPIIPIDVEKVISIFQKEEIKFYVKDMDYDDDLKRGIFAPGKKLKGVYMFFTDDDLSAEKADHIIKTLHEISDLSIHKTHHKYPQKYALNITHVNATKLHGIFAIQKKLGVTKDETIGVGDSYNDFPLLMASGLKVAMGNAVPELKEIADYIAPSVGNDGVVHVIEKFILENISA